MISFITRTIVAFCILVAATEPTHALSRKEALGVTRLHLVKAKLCAVAEGRNATFIRAVEISKRRLVRAGYSKLEADAKLADIVKRLNAAARSGVPYVRKICVGEIGALERQ